MGFWVELLGLLSDLKTAVQKAMERLQKRNFQQQLEVLLSHIDQKKKATKIALPSLDHIDFVDIHRICYCNASDNYTQVKDEGEPPILISKTLKEFELLL
jgi:two-component system LytT family response regulator